VEGKGKNEGAQKGANRLLLHGQKTAKDWYRDHNQFRDAGRERPGRME